MKNIFDEIEKATDLLNKKWMNDEAKAKTTAKITDMRKSIDEVVKEALHTYDIGEIIDTLYWEGVKTIDIVAHYGNQSYATVEIKNETFSIVVNLDEYKYYIVATTRIPEPLEDVAKALTLKLRDGILKLLKEE